MESNIVQRVLDKDIENIIKKVAQGKPLSAIERARIEAYNRGEAPSEDQTYVGSLVELAEALGVTRMTVDRWRKKKGAPKPAPNGKHNVVKWREFVRANDLKTPEIPEEEALKLRKLHAEVQQAELKVEVAKRGYISIEEIRETWTRHIGDVRRVLESRLLNELPPLLQSLNAIEIREKLQDVLDEVYRDIQQTVVEMNADFEARDRERVESLNNPPGTAVS